MEFKLIDFSEVYYRKIAKVQLPASRRGKFIQLRNEDTEIEFVVLSPQELSVYHANIVERFCMLHKIKGEYTTKRVDHYVIIDPDWTVIGGGKWCVDDQKKLLHLFDKSGIYGKFDSTGLKENILMSGNLKGYNVKLIS